MGSMVFGPGDRPVGMTAEDVVRLVRHYKEEAFPAFAERKKVMDECWRGFLGQPKQTREPKEPWQSNVFVPEVMPKVKLAANILKNMLFSGPSYSQVRMIEKLSAWHGQNARESMGEAPMPLRTKSETEASAEAASGVLYRFLEKTNIRRKLTEMIESALITGLGVMKVYWDREANGLGLGAVDPYNVLLDPHSRSFAEAAYVIETKMEDLQTLRALEAEGVYFNVDQVMESLHSEKRSEALRRKGVLSTTNPYRKRVEVCEFWGDIVDEDGVLLDRNVVVTIANEEVLLRYVRNPFTHQKRPYIMFSPLSVPFRFPGMGLAEAILGIQDAINQIVSAQLDNLKYQLMPIFALNPNAIDNMDELSYNGLKPGTVVLTRDPGAFVKIAMGDDMQAAFTEMDLLQDASRRSTGISNLLEGSLSKRFMTASEVLLKNREASLHFRSIAKDLASLVLQPLKELAYSLIVQFGPSSIVGARRAAPVPLEQPATDREERSTLPLPSELDFSVSPISGSLDSFQSPDLLLQFLSTLKGVPGLLELLDGRELLTTLLSLLNLPSPQLLLQKERSGSNAAPHGISGQQSAKDRAGGELFIRRAGD